MILVIKFLASLQKNIRICIVINFQLPSENLEYAVLQSPCNSPVDVQCLFTNSSPSASELDPYLNVHQYDITVVMCQ